MRGGYSIYRVTGCGNGRPHKRRVRVAESVTEQSCVVDDRRVLHSIIEATAYLRDRSYTKRTNKKLRWAQSMDNAVVFFYLS